MPALSLNTMPDATPDALVRRSDDGPVRTLTLNRPAVLNSFNAALHAALAEALDAAAADRHVRCVLLTGAGRAFCAGQDLADVQGTDLGEVLERFYHPLVRRLRALPVPVVAAVNGVAAGAGACLALHCDVVLAGRGASFAQAFARVGLVPDSGGTWLLPRLVGRARALGLALLGDRLPAGEAERMGLIWRCVDDADLSTEAHAVAARLAALPTGALVATREAFDAAQHRTLDEALAGEAVLQRRLGAGADHREGVAAFLAKRAPRFPNR